MQLPADPSYASLALLFRRRRKIAIASGVIRVLVGRSSGTRLLVISQLQVGALRWRYIFSAPAAAGLRAPKSSKAEGSSPSTLGLGGLQHSAPRYRQ